MIRLETNRLGGAGVRKSLFLAAALILMALGLSVLPNETRSAESSDGGTGASPPTGEKILKWGGELKFIGIASWPGEETLLQPQGNKTFFDGLAEGRLKAGLFFADWGNLEFHNVIGASGGDLQKAVNQSPFPVYISQGGIPGAALSDKRQLLDLAWTPVENDAFVLYDRVDRLALTLQKDWVLVRFGRQAITWGNGLIFHPMDLINPFSPADVVREYKTGQDMAFAQVSMGSFSNLQLLYSPRRDPETGRVEGEESTFAGKFHFAIGKNEFDIMIAKNFGDRMIGIGGAGYIGGAAWRLDATWTWLDQEGGHGYLSAVANLDTSWRWRDRNWYGFVEFFFNGLGKEDYSAALNSPDIQKKISQGQLFTLGKWYAAGTLRLELHPLFNVYLTVINNVADPSGIIQPRVTWDFAQNFKIILWGNVTYGREGTEYGGFPVQGTALNRKPPSGAFAWLSYYF